MTDDTRYDEYFAAALGADAHANDARRGEAVRSLAAQVEAHLAAQDLPADIRRSELALARAAADKLLSSDGADGATPSAGDSASAQAAGKSRIVVPTVTRTRAAIALACTLVYLLPLFFFSRESQDAGAVDAKGAEIALSVSIGVAALQDENLSLHIQPVSGSQLGADGHLKQEVTLRLDPGSGPVTHTFPANAHQTPWDVTVIAVSGDILDYPLDRYRFEIDVDGKSNGEPILVEASLGAVPHGLRAHLDENREAGGATDVAIDVRRSGSVIFLAALSTFSLLVVAIAALSVAWQVADKGRRIDFSMMTWVAAFMFVIPAVRNSLPGSPPIGALIDYLLFFWLQFLAATATTTLVVIWMREKPASG